jgi:hypothetical protein
MLLRSIRHMLAAAFLVIAFGAHAQETLPPPVNGITFEEWAAGNARLSNQQPLADILAVLKVDEATWNATNQAFIKTLQEGDPASYTFKRYAEVFANPAAGRFKGRNDQPEIEGKLATFEDYARVQAHLTVASEAGEDPEAVLKEHNLTAYEFSQESGNWVRVMTKAAGTDEMERMDNIREYFEAEYRARYKLAPKN